MKFDVSQLVQLEVEILQVRQLEVQAVQTEDIEAYPEGQDNKQV
jgi:hypothetical protein